MEKAREVEGGKKEKREYQGKQHREMMDDQIANQTAKPLKEVKQTNKQHK
jgi:hypothetical protein